MSKLINYAKIILGGTPATNRPDFWEGEIPWISVVDFTDSKKIYTTEKTITESGLRQSNTKLLNEGDIIVSARGTVGKMAVCGKKMAFNQSCYALLTKDNNKLNQNFLFYLLQEKIKYLRQMAVGGVFNTIIKSTLEKIPVELPDIPIQVKIADILSVYDDLIDTNRRRIQLLEEAARLLFREWFVYFRFPGHEKVKIVDGVPEGWKKGNIKDISEVKSGYAFNSKAWLDEGNPVIKIGNIIGDGTINLDDCSFIDQDVAAKAKDFSLKKGDLLIAMTGATIGKVGLLSENSKTVYLNQRVGKFIPKLEGAELILYCFFMSTNAQNYITNYAGGAAQPNISASQIESIKIIVATRNFYNQFVDLVGPMFGEILNLRSQNQKLAQARDLLLPRLMSGKIEV